MNNIIIYILLIFYIKQLHLIRTYPRLIKLKIIYCNTSEARVCAVVARNPVSRSTVSGPHNNMMSVPCVEPLV